MVMVVSVLVGKTVSTFSLALEASADECRCFRFES